MAEHARAGFGSSRYGGPYLHSTNKCINNPSKLILTEVEEETSMSERRFVTIELQ